MNYVEHNKNTLFTSSIICYHYINEMCTLLQLCKKECGWIPDLTLFHVRGQYIVTNIGHESICFTRTMNTYKVCVTVNLYTHVSTRVYKRSSFPCLRQVPKFHELCDLPIVDKSYKLGTLRQCSDSVDEMFRVIMANRLSQRQSPKFDEG